MILVIAMTLIAVLGASFVSIIGSKNEGFVFIIRGQKANMITKAGVEWAIRYIGEGLLNEDSNYYRNKPHLQPTGTTGSSFADGIFTATWTYNVSNIENDNIKVNGTYQGVTETITLSSFRTYLYPIMLSPTTSPDTNSYNDVYVTVIENQSGIDIEQFDLRIADSPLLLREIWVYNSIDGSKKVFTFSDDKYPECDYSSYPNCVRPCICSIYGLLLPDNSYFTIDLLKHTLRSDAESLYTLRFYPYYLSSHQHSLRFYSTPNTTIMFTP